MPAGALRVRVPGPEPWPGTVPKPGVMSVWHNERMSAAERREVSPLDAILECLAGTQVGAGLAETILIRMDHVEIGPRLTGYRLSARCRRRRARQEQRVSQNGAASQPELSSESTRTDQRTQGDPGRTWRHRRGPMRACAAGPGRGGARPWPRRGRAGPRRSTRPGASSREHRRWTGRTRGRSPA